MTSTTELQEMTQKPRLGVDVGEVILHREPDDWKWSKYQPVKFVDNALDGLKYLSQKYELYLVSYCKRKMKSKSREKLTVAGIPAFIPEERWHFVRNRKDKAKVMTEFKLSGLIDDREDVLDALVPLSQVHRYWFGGNKQSNKSGHFIVKDWVDVKQQL